MNYSLFAVEEFAGLCRLIAVSDCEFDSFACRPGPGRSVNAAINGSISYTPSKYPILANILHFKRITDELEQQENSDVLSGKLIEVMKKIADKNDIELLKIEVATQKTN